VKFLFYLQESKESMDVLRFQGLVAYSSVGWFSSFLKTHWVWVLQELPWFFNYFSRDLGKVSKFWKIIFTWFSKCRVSHISNLPIFKDGCHVPIFKNDFASNMFFF
jgi:hypothetical protein